jgi:hypothetical protein
VANLKGSASPEQASIKIAEWLMEQRKYTDVWEGSYSDLAEASGASPGSASGYLSTRYRRGIVERIAIIDGRVQYRVDLTKSEVFNTRRMNAPGGKAGRVGRTGGYVRVHEQYLPFVTTRHLYKTNEHVFVLRNKKSNDFWLAPMGRNPQDCWDKAIEWEKMHGVVPDDWAKEMHANGWRVQKVSLVVKD